MAFYSSAPTDSNGAFTGTMVQNEQMKSFDHNSIYRSRQFNEAMNYFDITDDMTRNVLLSVNEADQNVVMTSLSNKLYQHIVDKVDKIDFGTIPASMGDITKIDNYDNLVDCLNIITQILQQYNQPVDNTVGVINQALSNMIDRTDMFVKAHKLKVEMPIIIYNTMALSIVASTSLMITSCIEFVKLPDDQGFEIAVDKAGVNNSMNSVLFDDLRKFNKMCADGSFDKSMDYIIAGTSKGFTGGTMLAFSASSVAVVLGLLLLIIPVIRELIFFFYYSRASVAEYFDAQSTLLQMNAYNVENSLTRTPQNKKKIAADQRKVADVFKKIANKVRVSTKQGERDSAKEISKLDSKKYKQNEILDTVPDSANSVLF